MSYERPVNKHHLHFANDDFEVSVKANVPDDVWMGIVTTLMHFLTSPPPFVPFPLTDEERDRLVDEFTRPRSP